MNAMGLRMVAAVVILAVAALIIPRTELPALAAFGLGWIAAVLVLRIRPRAT